MEKELCKVPCIKYFEDSNFISKYNNDDIILNSIKVAILNEDNCFDKYIPFDISVGGEGECLIKPAYSRGKFVITYERFAYVNKITIPANQLQYYMNNDGDFEIVIE